MLLDWANLGSQSNASLAVFIIARLVSSLATVWSGFGPILSFVHSNTLIQYGYLEAESFYSNGPTPSGHSQLIFPAPSFTNGHFGRNAFHM